MSIWNRVKSQLRSVIEWENPSQDVLFYLWTENGDEIKNASKLIVGPGQGAIFVYEGRTETVITDEGAIELKTANIPFWTTISKFMQAFESEHKVGIYFFRKAKVLDCKWGTPTVVKYEDPKYKFPVGLRAFGNYSFQIQRPSEFFTSIVAGKSNYTSDEFKEMLSARLLQPLTDYLAESKYSYADIDAKREEISEELTQKISGLFGKLGFLVTDFRIEGTSFDESTVQRINHIANVQAESQAAQAAGIDYKTMRQLDAMSDAAKNEGGIAGLGVGMGAGVGLGQGMAGAFSQIQPDQEDPMQKLETLKHMLQKELISQKEFEQKKKEILSKI